MVFGFKKYRDGELFKLFDEYKVKVDKDRIFIKKSESVNASEYPFINFTSKLREILTTKELFSTIIHEKGHSTPKCLLLTGLTLAIILSFVYYLPDLIYAVILNSKLLINFIILLLIYRFGVGYLTQRILYTVENNADIHAVKILRKNRTWLINSLNKVEKEYKRRQTKKLTSKSMKFLYILFFYPFHTHPDTKDRKALIRSYKIESK